MSVEERQLLRAMCGIVGRIQIQGDAMSAVTQPLGMTPDYAVGQKLAQAIQFFYPNPVLETRQGRLRSQVATLDRVAIQKQFVNRIPSQAGGVVRVCVAAGDREHSLPHQLAQRMIHLASLPLLSKTGGQPGHQSVMPIGGLQQQCSAVGTPLALIKPGYYGLVENSWEQQTLCCAIVRHSEASFAASNTVSTTCL